MSWGGYLDRCESRAGVRRPLNVPRSANGVRGLGIPAVKREANKEEGKAETRADATGADSPLSHDGTQKKRKNETYLACPQMMCLGRNAQQQGAAVTYSRHTCRHPCAPGKVCSVSTSTPLLRDFVLQGQHMIHALLSPFYDTDHAAHARIWKTTAVLQVAPTSNPVHMDSVQQLNSAAAAM